MRTKKDTGWGHLYRFTAKGLAKEKFNAYESKILWAIVYKTIAFNKESDHIPERQFEDLTGIDSWHHKRPINSLLKKKVIWRKGNEYGLCERFLEIEKAPNQVGDKEEAPNQEKRAPNQVLKSTSLGGLIRASHKSFHKKGLSTSEKREKRKEYKTGLAMLKEAIKRGSDRKKEVGKKNF